MASQASLFHRRAVDRDGEIQVESLCNFCDFQIGRSDVYQLVREESAHLLVCANWKASLPAPKAIAKAQV